LKKSERERERTERGVYINYIIPCRRNRIFFT